MISAQSRAVLLPILAALVVPQASRGLAQVALPDAKPVPRMQVVPLDGDRASFRRDGAEIAVYHFGPTLHRPFLFPIIGPSGRSLTRMGHPRDPVGHSHHNSFWVSHNNVGGDDFWGDSGPGRIVHRKILRYDDSDDAARIVAQNAWVGKDDKVLLGERRGMEVRPLSQGQWLLLLDLQFEADKEPVTIGKTPFGMVGVRMAKTIGLNDGGGLIRNSEGNVNETGPNGVFRKKARWVDYSGPIAPGVAEGITLFDHPGNPNHPNAFHVRADGWMGACLTLDEAIVVSRGKPLRLRYGLLVHGGMPETGAIEEQWRAFAREPIVDLPAK